MSALLAMIGALVVATEPVQVTERTVDRDASWRMLLPGSLRRLRGGFHTASATCRRSRTAAFEYAGCVFKQAEDGMTQSLGDMLISWAPMLLLIGVWVFFAQRAQRAQQKQQDYMAVVQTYVTEHIAETKRMSQNLERIANALERRQA